MHHWISSTKWIGDEQTRMFFYRTKEYRINVHRVINNLSNWFMSCRYFDISNLKLRSKNHKSALMAALRIIEKIKTNGCIDLETLEQVNNTILYLLPYKSNRFFKIGISTDFDTRFEALTKRKILDKDNTIIVSAKKSSTIKALERQLHEDLSDFSVKMEYLEKRDCLLENGNSEVFLINGMQDALDIINEKSNRFKSKKIQIDFYRILTIKKTD